MSNAEEGAKTIQVPRRIPALITYLHPFRLIQGEGIAEWETSIDEINESRWDYVKLHEIVGGLDVGLPQPFHLVVVRDGALALPPIPELRGDQEAVEFFNRCLAALLLGGVYCESITLDNLEFGFAIDWKYLRSAGQGKASSNRFHLLIRHRQAAPLEAIELLNPRIQQFNSLQEAMKVGLSALDDVTSLSGEFLLKGVTGIARRDWGAALANLWIVIEQITAFLWEKEIVSKLPVDQRIDGRREQLKDTRSWGAANRQELLHQKGVVATSILQNLYLARKSRNALVHRGAHPQEDAGRAAYAAATALLQIALGGRHLPLFDMNLDDHSLSDPFRPVEAKSISPQYWMPIPKLPGEEEIERDEASKRSPNGA
ncbi:MAG: hypothetical protein ACO1NY_15185 [Pseudorhodoplanes sp.]